MVSVAAVEQWIEDVGLGPLENWQRERLQALLAPRLAESVVESVSQDRMPWLTPADGAAKLLAMTYAERIDEAIDTGKGEEITKALYLGPHLLKALESLGATPLGRKQATTSGSGKEGVRGQLTLLKDQQAARSSGTAKRPARKAKAT